MAAPGAFTMFDKALLNCFNDTNLLNQAKSYSWTLHTNAWVPSISGNEVFADATSQLATGNGYTAGGIAMGNDAISLTAGVVKFTGDPVVWTASGGSIPAFRYAVLRAVGTINGKVDPLVGYFVADSAPADYPATTTGNTLTLSPNAGGLGTITHTP